MATICPIVTAHNADEFRKQMELLAKFAVRVHIDIGDGVFTRAKLVSADDVWWPSGMRADLHVLYKEPFRHTKELLHLRPQLIIVHAEAEGNFPHFAHVAHAAGVAVGVALKPETPIKVILPALPLIDHVLVFSGRPGHFGGHANTHLLTKVLHLKRLKPHLEIGWDGGVSDKNAATLAAAGVDVLNAGGFIHHAADPEAAYERLEEAAKKGKAHRIKHAG